jgi:hypothetical protein
MALSDAAAQVASRHRDARSQARKPIICNDVSGDGDSDGGNARDGVCQKVRRASPPDTLH